MTAPTNTERAQRNASFLAFVAWAACEGYDTAHTYDTDRSVWIAFSPMTADLWRAWQAARADSQAQIASVTAERDTLRASIDALFDLTKDSAEQLREERDEAMARVAALKKAGAPMANTMFNLAQREHWPAFERESFKAMQVAWDAALAAPSPPTLPAGEAP